MSSAGQLIGGGVGGIAGFFIAGPTGAKYGAQIGIMLGGIIDPPKGPDVKGPRLDDLSVQTSTYGAIIPRAYGTTTVFGNIFWLENNQIKEIAKKKKSGGKGGQKSTATTYSYYATFALGLCEGPIVAVRRIWISGKLLYDAGTTDQGAMRASNQAAGYFTLYTGTDTQTADPRMQATLGATNVPGYRGLAYLVFNDLPLADYGNTLMGAQIKVEVVSDGSIVDYDIVGDWMPNTTAWDSLAWNGRLFLAGNGSPIGSIELASSPDGITWTTRLLPAGAANASNGMSIAADEDIFVVTSGYSSLLWLSKDTINWRSVSLAAADWYNVAGDGEGFICLGETGSSYFSEDGGIWNATGAMVSPGINVGGVAGNGEIWVAVKPGYGYAQVYDPITDTWQAYAMPGAGYDKICWADDLGIFLAQAATYGATSPDGETWTAYTNTCTPSFLIRASGYFWAGEFWSVDGVTWQTKTYPGSGFGINIYAAAWNGAILCVIGSGTYQNAWTITPHQLTQAYPTLANVVEAELLKSNLLDAADLNVTALSSITVRGYSIASVAAIRSGLEPLQAAWPFDVIQSGYKIKFVKRGGSSVATVSAGELDARGSGDTPGVSIANIREMDIVLPRKVRLIYADVDREYDVGEQYAERLNTDAVNIRTVELAIVLNAAEAAGMAEVLLYLAWLERYDITLSLPPTYNHLEPADVITVNASEGQYVLRLTSVNYTADGRIACQAKYNSIATYTATALGVAGAVTETVLAETGQTAYAVLDIPTIIDTADTPGVVVAMAGYAAGWSGGTLFKSDDAGQIWADLQGTSAPGTTMGTCTALASGRTDIIDTANSITVTLIEGALSSVSESSLFAGANWFAIGDHGRWEIVAAKTCTLVSGTTYTVSDFLRGRYGTEWAMDTHIVGDWIIRLDGDTAAFVNYALSAIGASHYYRGITNGDAFDSVSDRVQEYTGVCLECLAPVYFNGSKDPVTNDWNITWIRRTRIGGEWRDLVDAPLSETSESYSLDIFADGLYSAIVRTVTTSAASFAYTSAMQVADFGAVQPFLVVNIYQVSDKVGRGYPLAAWLPRTPSPPWPSVMLLPMSDAGLSDVYGHTVTLVGGVARSAAQSRFGGYSSYHANNPTPADYLNVTGLPAIGTQSFCAEAWVYQTDLSAGFQNILVSGTGGDWTLQAHNAYLVLKVFGTTWINVASCFVANTWQHVRLSFNHDTDTFRAYVDGVEKGSVSGLGYSGVGTNMYIGSYNYRGYIDDARLTIGNDRAADVLPPLAKFIE